MDGFYGRLGNRLASAEKMIGVAEKYSCNVTLPMLLDGWRGAPSRFLNMKSGDASLSNSTSSQCVIQHGYIGGVKRTCHQSVTCQCFGRTS